MKKANVPIEVAQSVNESAKTKGSKVSNCETSQKVATTKKESKANFLSYVISKEQISVSKFFRLFNEFKAESPLQYAEYISAYNLNLNTEYSFDWFKANCPKDENGNFAKWAKVSEKNPANKKAEFNRTTEKGVSYTLVAFPTLKANYEQFLSMFQSVLAEVKRIEREKAKAEREAEKAKAKKEAEKKQNEKNVKAVNEIFAEIESLSKEFSLPFETAISVYEKSKKANYSKELRAMLVAKANEQK